MERMMRIVFFLPGAAQNTTSVSTAAPHTRQPASNTCAVQGHAAFTSFTPSHTHVLASAPSPNHSHDPQRKALLPTSTLEPSKQATFQSWRATQRPLPSRRTSTSSCPSSSTPSTPTRRSSSASLSGTSTPPSVPPSLRAVLPPSLLAVCPPSLFLSGQRARVRHIATAASLVPHLPPLPPSLALEVHTHSPLPPSLPPFLPPFPSPPQQQLFRCPGQDPLHVPHRQERAGSRAGDGDSSHPRQG